MDESKEAGGESHDAYTFRHGLWAFALVALLAVAIALSGCATKPAATIPQVVVKSKYELALEQIDLEWLTPCAGIPPAENYLVADLLNDFTLASAALSVCASRHLELANYLRPLVEAARNK